MSQDNPKSQVSPLSSCTDMLSLCQPRSLNLHLFSDPQSPLSLAKLCTGKSFCQTLQRKCFIFPSIWVPSDPKHNCTSALVQFLSFSDLISVKMENNRSLRALLDAFTPKENLIEMDNLAADCRELVQEATHIHTHTLLCSALATVLIPLF